MKDKILAILKKLAIQGIYIPMVRDPKTSQPSVSLTLLCLSTLVVLVGLFGKWSRKFGGVDMADALQFFYCSCALYFGRNLSTKAGSIGADSDPTGEANHQ